MEHLTVDEMIGFVSFDTLDRDAYALASKVNAHILRCRECREKVAAFQTVFDEFVEIGRRDEFNERAKEMSEEKIIKGFIN